YFRYIAAVNAGGVVTSSGTTLRTLVAGGPLYWIAGSASNWNNAANWSTSSGGAGGAGVPGAGNDAFFDGNGLGNCTIDTTVTVSTLTISTATAGSYTGKVDTSSNTITV